MEGRKFNYDEMKSLPVLSMGGKLEAPKNLKPLRWSFIFTRNSRSWEFRPLPCRSQVSWTILVLLRANLLGTKTFSRFGFSGVNIDRWLLILVVWDTLCSNPGSIIEFCRSAIWQLRRFFCWRMQMAILCSDFVSAQLWIWQRNLISLFTQPFC